MADTSNPNPAPKPSDKAAVAPAPTVTVLMERDYWPKGPRPADLPEDQEYRVRAGESAELSVDEAMDVVEAGIGRRDRAKAA
ncbi:MAG: hypothetical protein K2X54_31665 [Methylobacterium organophilum]|nr:hypothetical protein [Methylobacterium organophilum]